ncbi:C40 family peptidase [Archangium violaceum]|uniref:NlpC/P60 family protein n=1 Tax=Archangium violaceum TaxID=83451 RepID=UPI00194FECB7|nr:NlpC/P60 family protein [Archangium violaceum]QRN98914.1 C40 family peptidase [Archangium violaceum]
MRCLALVPVCLLVACAGTAPARRPALTAEPLPVAAEAPRVAAGGVESAVLEGVAHALITTVDAARLVSSAASLRAWHPGAPGTPSGAAALIVERAVQLVGVKRLGSVARGVPDDCSGFVRLAYQRAGIDLVSHGFLGGENAVSAIFRRAQGQGALRQRARPGDLVFFRETYDRNRDGLRNDGMTHIGVVETLEPDGTVTFIHRGSKGIARSRMNLFFPRTHRVGQDGPVLNDYLRAASRGQRAWLAGELFAGFASPGPL